MSKHTLIGGGTGFIGSHLSKHLAKNGYEVTVISRMPGPKRITWHELEKQGIPSSVNSVVNATGQNVLDPSRRWTPGFQQNVWNSRVNSSKTLSQAIQAAPQVKSFVNLCGVSLYPPSETKTYTEDDQGVNYDYMSSLCLAWEEAARSGDSKDKCSIVRTGAVVGRNGGMIKSIWLPFKLGLGGPMGAGNQIMPWIHMHDLCGLIQHLIENCESGVFNGVAPEIVSNKGFSQAFASALNRPCLFAVPEFVVQAIFGKERSALLLSGAKIQPKRTLASGYQFKYPDVKSAVAEVVGK
ncbi:PREDICTED: epimerase family protein SDR39U1 isoform X1 [Drosophila arizonae]|uniref:Epimerase family protein SDR39U1 isoform X1 n=1 Tax=Drosophila arizonae TaxID=7263 RepID=A0ABM1PIG1_DROAR|nr:PREDICTED: epimerase family protein SDR39U1 isoform X1 [Drosophila arizonae]